MPDPRYAIYPSLLDQFQALLDYQIEAEQPWNVDLTADQVYDNLEQRLIDSINRVPRPPSVAADRGTAFNEIVDCLVHYRPSANPDVEIHSCGNVIEATVNSELFRFDRFLCQDVARRCHNALSQFLTKAVIPTPRGNVLLYGYIDEWIGPEVIDIKTTARYSFPKFDHHWQQHLYPWCLISSGLIDTIHSFTYLTVLLNVRDDKPITGTIYPERYSYNHEYSTRRLTQILTLFIDWLEFNRHRITHPRIFAPQ